MTIDLEAIKARAAAATEGPWLANATDDETACVVDSEFISIADCEDDTEDGYRNAEFIAAARTDVPVLVELVREGRDRLEEAEREVERLRAIVEAVEKLRDALPTERASFYAPVRHSLDEALDGALWRESSRTPTSLRKDVQR
jgi:chlorite dismutase